MEINKSTGPVGPERISTELKAGHGKPKAKVQHLADKVNDLPKVFAKTSTDAKLDKSVTKGPIPNNPRA
jgi:hypothetical protein